MSLRFGVRIPTCIEGMMYPVPFARPEDILPTAILADAGLDAARTLPFREALLRGERAGHLVTDEVLDAVAVAGTPADCRRALARWAEAGLDAAVAVVPPEADMLEQLTLIGAELSPHWKEMRCR